MQCARCGGPMTFVQGQWWCEACKAFGVMTPGAPTGGPPPMSPEKQAKVRSMLNWSHVLGWGGLGVMLLGPIPGGMLGGVTGAVAVGAFGFVSCVVGAVIGQIARGMQGRVI